MGTLAMCLVLLGVLALGAAWAVRQLSTAQRIAANDLRASAAFEAAEAGSAWAVAMLNGGTVDDACRPAAGTPGQLDFRGRYLLIGADGHYRAASREASNGTSPAAPSCINPEPLRWACSCGARDAGATATAPSTDGSGDPSAAASGLQPRFTVRLADAAVPGQLRLVVRGCSDRRLDCDDLGDGPAGLAESAQHLALLSALRVPPATALVEGPGSFQRVFGIPPARYRGQPAIARLRCEGDCAGSLAQALARGRRLIWIDGDASLDRWPEGALDGLPLVLVVQGRLELTAPGHAQGVLYARDGIRWHPPAGMAATLRGAAVTEGALDKSRTVELVHDPAVLTRIHRQMGSFLPVPGGWTPTR